MWVVHVGDGLAYRYLIPLITFVPPFNFFEKNVPLGRPFMASNIGRYVV
jgi:hypothetical protein